jgi:hypothetical protein
MSRTGQLLSSWELAREYRFTDADGSRPDWSTSEIDFSQLPPELVTYIRTGGAISIEWLKTLTKRTQRFMKRLPKSRVP